MMELFFLSNLPLALIPESGKDPSRPSVSHSVKSMPLTCSSDITENSIIFIRFTHLMYHACGDSFVSKYLKPGARFMPEVLNLTSRGVIIPAA